MKKNDTILDFTSLLDVTLIVIFFFVLFSHLENEDNKAKTNEKVQELEVAIQEAETREMEAESAKNALEEELQLVTYANERNGSNVSEILKFSRSQNLKIILDMQSDSWTIRVTGSSGAVEYLDNKEDITEDLISSMEKLGYSSGKTIFCDFVYDGAVGGSRSAYQTIRDSLDEISKIYKFMYISETDLSMGKVQ